MHLVYYDESGDDGFPMTTSPLFVLAALYCPAGDWRENFEIVQKFRRQLAKEKLLPFDLEIHARELILNKKPYAPLRLSDEHRLLILERFCHLIAQLSARAVVTAVIKPWIRAKTFDVLDKALSYSINRIETDLRSAELKRFLIITDQGRVAKCVIPPAECSVSTTCLPSLDLNLTAGKSGNSSKIPCRKIRASFISSKLRIFLHAYFT